MNLKLDVLPQTTINRTHSYQYDLEKRLQPGEPCPPTISRL